MARVSGVQPYLVPKGRFKLVSLLNYYSRGLVSNTIKRGSYCTSWSTGQDLLCHVVVGHTKPDWSVVYIRSRGGGG